MFIISPKNAKFRPRLQPPDDSPVEFPLTRFQDGLFCQDGYDTTCSPPRTTGHAGGSPAFSFCFLYREYQASISGDIDIISSRKFLSTISDFAFAIHSGCDFG